MNTFSKSLLAAGVASCIWFAPAEANTLVIQDQLEQLSPGNTNFDTWKFKVLANGTFTVDVAAYEATQSNVATAGYATHDINNDGELTWLDADTQWYKDDGHLDSPADAIVRCDDTANNCPRYPGATQMNQSPVVPGPISIATHQQSEAALDGSVHFRRDPWYDITFTQTGDFLFLVAAYTLNYAEANSGVNTTDFSPPTGFVGTPTLDHADYKITFSSDTLNFSRVGNTINVTSVPLPGAVWLFGSAIAGLMGCGRRKTALRA